MANHNNPRNLKSDPLQELFLLFPPRVLGIMTAVALMLTIPDQELLRAYIPETLVYGFLVGFALFFGVWLSDETRLGPAHVVGMVAFLSLPAEACPVLTWAVFMGGLLGGVALVWHGSRRGYPLRHYISSLVLMGARVTLSFAVAGWVYVTLEGALPLQHIPRETFPDEALALVIYGLVYIGLYFGIFALELYANAYSPAQIVKTKLVTILIILLLPIPFAVFSAEVADNFSTSLELTRLLGLAVVIIGLHALSQSEHRLRRQLNDLHTLAEIRRSMRSHLDLDELLMAIYRHVVDLLEVPNLAIALCEGDRARLELALVIRKGQRASKEDQGPLLSHLTHSPLTYVFQTSASLLLSHNVQASAQAMRLQTPGDDVVSWMGAPLLLGERKLGVLAVSSTDPTRRFDKDDLHLLGIIVDSASVAIDNALLYSQQKTRLEQISTLNRIVAMLSGTLMPETVLDTVISSASALTEANAVAIYLLSEDGRGVLPLVRCAGVSDHFSNNPPMPLLWRDRSTPLHLQKPLLIPDLTQDSRLTHRRDLAVREGLTSLVELPLATGENDLGVLVMYFTTAQHFDDEQLEVMRTFATQVAQSITNARTYTTTDAAFQRSLEQLLALAEIGRVLTTMIDLKAVGELTLNRLLESTKANRGLVVIYDDAEGQLKPIAQSGYVRRRFKDPDTLFKGIGKQVLIHGKIQLISDVTTDANYYEWHKATRSQLGAPLFRGGEQRGYIALESDLVNGFSAEDTHFAAQVANQAVVAIDNALLFMRITEARDRLQAILNAMEEAVILIDNWGKIVLVNPRIEMLGLEPGTLLNCYLTDLLRDTTLEFAERLGFESIQVMAQIFYDLSRSESWRAHDSLLYMMRTEQGELYLQRYIIPVTDEQGQVIGSLLVFYDQTEEQELNRAREEFSRMIVHDLRSPLTAVTASLKLLCEVATEEDDLYPVIQTTTESSHRALRKLLGRVDSLLDIARMESGKLDIDTDYTEFAPLAENVCVELQPLAQELDIQLRIEIDDDLPLLDIDAEKVERLLLNLVDNALKYSPAESEILIRAHSPGTHTAETGFIRVDIMDTGPGIPDDYKSILFDRFVQIKGREKVRRGVGLGLTFCKLVVEAHRGRIWIEDNQGGGSIFSFTLPIAELSRLPDDEE